MRTISSNTHILWFLAFIACVAAARCSAAAGRSPLDQSLARAFDARRAWRDLEAVVAIGERVAGTEGAERAARLIEKRLKEAGVTVTCDEFTDVTPDGRMRFINLIAKIPGDSNHIVIVGGHYDTKSGIGPGFQGANDSGSSTAVLLELARVLSQNRWAGPEVWLAFFDGEECRFSYGPHDGLHGSRHLARRLQKEGIVPRVRAVIVVDMVGDADLKLTIPANSDPGLRRLLLESARDQGLSGYVTEYRGEIIDDHTPFLAAGIPAIDLIDFCYGSRTGSNDYWHTMGDSLAHVSQHSLGVTGQLVLRMLEKISSGDESEK